MKLKRLLLIDWWLITPILILIIIGLTTLYSISPGFFYTQLISVIISTLAFLLLSQIDYHLIKSFAIPFYVVSLIFLAVILVIGIESRGAVRWIDLLGIRLQYSEIAKPILSISFASYLSSHSNTSFKSFFQIILFILPVLLLIFLQPDLGTALIYGGVGLLTLITYGYPLWWFILCSLPGILSLPILWEFLHDYQRQRILTFIHPTNDPLGTSYNVIQAMIAVGSGMILGRGFSLGTQSGLRFLPERQTDFIFATLSEGLGFIGGTVVLLCFAIFFYRLITIALQSDDHFKKLFMICAFGFILIQVFVNIGMNIGLLPIVGVTLPFVSFGGSSLLSNFIFLGIITSFKRDERVKPRLEIR